MENTEQEYFHQQRRREPAPVDEYQVEDWDVADYEEEPIIPSSHVGASVLLTQRVAQRSTTAARMTLLKIHDVLEQVKDVCTICMLAEKVQANHELRNCPVARGFCFQCFQYFRAPGHVGRCKLAPSFPAGVCYRCSFPNTPLMGSLRSFISTIKVP